MWRASLFPHCADGAISVSDYGATAACMCDNLLQKKRFASRTLSSIPLPLLRRYLVGIPAKRDDNAPLVELTLSVAVCSLSLLMQQPVGVPIDPTSSERKNCLSLYRSAFFAPWLSTSSPNTPCLWVRYPCHVRRVCLRFGSE